MAFGSAAPEIIINAVATLQTMTAAGGAGGDSSATNLGVSAIIGCACRTETPEAHVENPSLPP